MAGKRKDVYLVVGGKYHDFDFARLELLKLLAEHDVIRVKVANDYSDVDAMCESDLLVTYTCDEVPDAAGQAKLKSYVENGGKWFALHATNSVLEWLSHDPPLLRTAGSPRFYGGTGESIPVAPPGRALSSRGHCARASHDGGYRGF